MDKLFIIIFAATLVLCDGMSVEIERKEHLEVEETTTTESSNIVKFMQGLKNNIQEVMHKIKGEQPKETTTTTEGYAPPPNPTDRQMEEREVPEFDAREVIIESYFPFFFGPKNGGARKRREASVNEEPKKGFQYLDIFPEYSLERDPFEPLIREERVVNPPKKHHSTTAKPSAGGTDKTTAKDDIDSTASPQILLEPPKLKGYHMPKRNLAGDTSMAYHNKGIKPMAPITDMYEMFLIYSLPIAICWTLLAIFCIFGFRPDGALCKKIFSTHYDPLTRKV